MTRILVVSIALYALGFTAAVLAGIVRTEAKRPGSRWDDRDSRQLFNVFAVAFGLASGLIIGYAVAS